MAEPFKGVVNVDVALNGGGEIRTLGTPIRRTTVFETLRSGSPEPKTAGARPYARQSGENLT
jgi:hypothetical protein